MGWRGLKVTPPCIPSETNPRDPHTLLNGVMVAHQSLILVVGVQFPVEQHLTARQRSPDSCKPKETSIAMGAYNSDAGFGGRNPLSSFYLPIIELGLGAPMIDRRTFAKGLGARFFVAST